MPTAPPTSMLYMTITTISFTTQTPVPIRSAVADTAPSNLTRAQAYGITAAALLSLFILAGIGLIILWWRRRIRFVRVPTIETEEAPTARMTRFPTAIEAPGSNRDRVLSLSFLRSEHAFPDQSPRQSFGHVVDRELGNEELNEEESMSLLESILEIYETPFPAGPGSPLPVSAFSVSSDGDERGVGNGKRATRQDSLPSLSDQRKWHARRRTAAP
ncbi:hypothetical protein LTR86_010800 [Recurvomyces mirabilis]|nr:hypothetical protein LTR86_010800 [Recurvomyces mirabilis]